MAMFGCFSRLMPKVPGSSPVAGFGQQSARGFMHQFWAKKTKYSKDPAQIGHNKLFKGNRNLRIIIEHKRPNFVQIAKKKGFSSLFKYETGRKQMMEKMVKGERKLVKSGMAAQQPLSGTIVVIIIAVGVQACIITFILAKRQIQRFALRNRRGPHTSVGHGAPKYLRRETDRLIEYVSHIKVDPPLSPVEAVRGAADDDGQPSPDYRRQTLLQFQSFEAELAGYSQNYARSPGTNIRSFLLSCQHGPLIGIDSKLIHQICDDHDAARHHYEDVTRVRFRTFLEKVDVLKAAVRANKLVKPVPSPLPPPRSGSPRKRGNRRSHKPSVAGTAVSFTNKSGGDKLVTKAPLLVSSVVSVENDTLGHENRANV